VQHRAWVYIVNIVGSDSLKEKTTTLHWELKENCVLGCNFRGRVPIISSGRDGEGVDCGLNVTDSCNFY